MRGRPKSRPRGGRAPLSVGLGLLTAQLPPGGGRSPSEEYRDLLRLARLAEKAGFDSVWLSEHHGAADGYLPSLPVLAAAIAAVTERIQIGFGVVLAPFQHPLRFAEDCAVLDQLARGRLIVGLAPGWREEEFRAFGVPRSERIRRTLELIRICKLAWSEERFSFSGRLFSYDQVAVTPKPFHPLPVYMGAFVEKAATRAGKIADGFLASRNDFGKFKSLVDAFDSGAREAGRDPSHLGVGFLQNTWVSADGRTPPEVVAGAWHQLGTYIAWERTDTPEARYELPQLDQSVVDARTPRGMPEQLLERLGPWIEAFGKRDLTAVYRLHYPGMTYDQAAPAVELFGSKVAPALKRLAP
jgi:alkanesulfonate monooxygenase SsuD/methylene tetrahydromethanopterin reductase-like flavin-dependent oxidoreductase (luciferase family)